MKRVLLYSDSSGVYGAERINHSLALALKNAGFRVVVAQPQGDNCLTAEREKLGIVHHWLPDENVYDWRHPAPSLLDPSVAEYCLEKWRPDLVVFADSFPFANLKAKQAAVARKAPYMIIVHCVQKGWAEQYCAFSAQLASLYRAAREVIAVSTDNLVLLRRHFGLGPDSGRVIYNGRPRTFFELADGAKRERLRRELGVEPDGIMVLSVGRFELVKGWQHLLDALPRLRRCPCWPRLSMVWVGGGTHGDRIRKLARLLGGNRVSVLPEREDVASLYDAADILAHPALYEGMPLVVLEAMAKGVVVVASAASGIPEAVADTGIIVDAEPSGPGFGDAFAKAIRLLTEDKKLRLLLSHGARERAKSHFTEERMQKFYVDLVRSSLNGEQ